LRLGTPLAFRPHSFVAKRGRCRIFSGRNPLRSIRLNFLWKGSLARSGVTVGIAGPSALRLVPYSAVGGHPGRTPDSGQCMSQLAALVCRIPAISLGRQGHKHVHRRPPLEDQCEWVADSTPGNYQSAIMPLPTAVFLPRSSLLWCQPRNGVLATTS